MVSPAPLPEKTFQVGLATSVAALLQLWQQVAGRAVALCPTLSQVAREPCWSGCLGLHGPALR